MSQQINFLNPGCNYNPDLLNHIFSFFEPKEVGQIMTVCHDWKEVAAKVAKILLLVKAENYLGQKLFSFFKSTGGNLKECFRNLTELSEQQRNLSVQALYDRLKILTTTEKFEISYIAVEYIRSDYNNFKEIQNLTDINSIAMPNPAEEEALKKMELTICNLYDCTIGRIPAIYEKPFIRLFYKEHWLDWMCHTSYEHIPDTGSSFFPIELFSLTARGKNHELEGTLQGKHYVPIKGRVVEFVIRPGLYLPRKANPVNSIFCLDPRQFYIPALDAKAAASLEDGAVE